MDDEIDFEEFWEELLAYIDERRVVPVIGSELISIARDGTGSSTLYTLLAQRLAEKLKVDIATLPAAPA